MHFGWFWHSERLLVHLPVHILYPGSVSVWLFGSILLECRSCISPRAGVLNSVLSRSHSHTFEYGDRGPKLRCFSSQTTTDQPASHPASRLLLPVSFVVGFFRSKHSPGNGNPLQTIVQPPKDGQHRLPGCMISTALPSLGRFFRDFLESGTQNKNYYSFPTFGYSLSVGAFGQFAAMVLCVIEAGCFFSP